MGEAWFLLIKEGELSALASCVWEGEDAAPEALEGAARKLLSKGSSGLQRLWGAGVVYWSEGLAAHLGVPHSILDPLAAVNPKLLGSATPAQRSAYAIAVGLAQRGFDAMIRVELLGPSGGRLGQKPCFRPWSFVGDYTGFTGSFPALAGSLFTPAAQQATTPRPVVQQEIAAKPVERRETDPSPGQEIAPQPDVQQSSQETAPKPGVQQSSQETAPKPAAQQEVPLSSAAQQAATPTPAVQREAPSSPVVVQREAPTSPQRSTACHQVMRIDEQVPAGDSRGFAELQLNRGVLAGGNQPFAQSTAHLQASLAGIAIAGFVFGLAGGTRAALCIPRPLCRAGCPPHGPPSRRTKQSNSSARWPAGAGASGLDQPVDPRADPHAHSPAAKIARPWIPSADQCLLAPVATGRGGRDPRRGFAHARPKRRARLGQSAALRGRGTS